MDKNTTNITIIGGAGKMGRWLAGFLREDNIRVVLADCDEERLREAGHQLGIDIDIDNVSAITGADYILLSVPIERFESVVEQLGPHFVQGQKVIDITSTKIVPVDIMHKYVRTGLVLGAHPLFGPGAGSIANKNVILTPTNEEETSLAVKLKWYLEKREAHVSLMTPAEHDEMMSLVLGLSHFIALVSADTLLGSGELRPMDAAGSSTYKVLLTLIESVLSEDPELYASIQMNLPDVTEFEKQFLVKTNEWANIVASKDRQTFANRMRELKDRLEKVAPDFIQSYEKMYRIVEGL
jgi:prephenate dehydrogenase